MKPTSQPFPEITTTPSLVSFRLWRKALVQNLRRACSAYFNTPLGCEITARWICEKPTSIVSENNHADQSSPQ